MSFEVIDLGISGGDPLQEIEHLGVGFLKEIEVLVDIERLDAGSVRPLLKKDLRVIIDIIDDPRLQGLDGRVSEFLKGEDLGFVGV